MKERGQEEGREEEEARQGGGQRDGKKLRWMIVRQISSGVREEEERDCTLRQNKINQEWRK